MGDQFLDTLAARLIGCAVLATLGGWSAAAHAQDSDAGDRKRVAVLKFTGTQAQRARQAVIAGLKRHATVVEEEDFARALEAAQGPTRPDRIAAACQAAGVDAVLEGSMHRARRMWGVEVFVRDCSNGEKVNGGRTSFGMRNLGGLRAIAGSIWSRVGEAILISGGSGDGRVAAAPRPARASRPERVAERPTAPAAPSRPSRSGGGNDTEQCLFTEDEPPEGFPSHGDWVRRRNNFMVSCERERTRRAAAERRARQEAQQRAREEAERRVREEAQRRAEAERRARLEVERQAREEADRRARREAERRAEEARIAREARRRAEEEARIEEEARREVAARREEERRAERAREREDRRRREDEELEREVAAYRERLRREQGPSISDRPSMRTASDSRSYRRDRYDDERGSSYDRGYDDRDYDTRDDDRDYRDREDERRDYDDRYEDRAQDRRYSDRGDDDGADEPDPDERRRYDRDDEREGSVASSGDGGYDPDEDEEGVGGYRSSQAALETTSDDGSAESAGSVSPPPEPTKRLRPTVFHIGAGVAFANRSMSVQVKGSSEPRTYSAPGYPELNIQAEFFPGAFIEGAGAAAGLGVFGVFRRHLYLQTSGPGGPTSPGAVIDVPTAEQELLGGLTFRATLGSRPKSPILSLGVGYGYFVFSLDPTKMLELEQDVQMATMYYQNVVGNAGIAIPITTSGIAIEVGASYRYVLDVGQAARDLFGANTKGGYGLGAHVGLSGEAAFIANGLGWSISADYTVFKTEFTGPSSCGAGAIDCFPSGSDQYIRGMFLAAYRYR